MSCVPCLRSSKCHGDMANLPWLLPNRSLNAKREFWLLQQHITVDRHGLCALTSMRTDCVHSPRYRQTVCTHLGTDTACVSELTSVQTDTAFVHSPQYRQTQLVYTHLSTDRQKACVSELNSVQTDTACVSKLTWVQTQLVSVNSPGYRQTKLVLVNSPWYRHSLCQ